MSGGDNNGRIKYAKIPLKDKISFLRMIKEEHISIKDSAAIFGINYSTAKTLIRQYRFNMFPYQLPRDKKQLTQVANKIQKNMLRCGYRSIDSGSLKIETSQTNQPCFYLHGQSALKREANEEVQGALVFLSKSIQLTKIEVFSSTLFE